MLMLVLFLYDKLNLFGFFTAKMSGVTKICAREIFDSRGNPTVEVDITTSKGKQDYSCTNCSFLILLT